jgi:hypothetical protein
MISAFEITVIILLAIGVGLVVWWYIEASNYDAMLDGVPFAKGANLIYKPEGTDADNTITMSCPEGKQVCVYQATQICTNPVNPNDDDGNYETSLTDPICSTLGDNWGKFNPATTIDLTADLNSNCGTGSGEAVSTGSCSYVFNPQSFPFSGGVCGNPNGVHLIATYTCQPAVLADGSQGTCQPTSPPGTCVTA